MRSPQEMSGTSPIKYILLGAGGLLFVSALIGGGIALLSSDDKTIKEDISPAQVDDVPSEAKATIEKDVIPAQAKETIAPAPMPQKAPKKKKKSATKKKNTTSRSTRSSSQPPTQSKPPKSNATKAQPSKKSSSKPKSVPVSGPFQVQVKFRGQEAKLFCGDGQTKEFVDAIMLSFSSKQACRIETEEGIRGLVRAEREGSITCKISGQKILCQ